MNILDFDRQVAVVSALTEGVSIRATERLTGVHRDTIMRLGVRVGEGCARLHDRTVHSVRVNRIELDEAWSYAGMTQRQLAAAAGVHTNAVKYWEREAQSIGGHAVGRINGLITLLGGFRRIMR
jgi:DNA-binding XRE family transcriptional regulator